MHRSDAELYLRLLGERRLAVGDDDLRHGHDSPLHEAAAALVAVGAISTPHAQAVIDDYTLAAAVRSEDGHRQIGWQTRQRPRRRRPGQLRLSFTRVVPCDHVIEDATGTTMIRYVALGRTGVSLAVSHRANVAAGRRAGHGRAFGGMNVGSASTLPWGAPAPTLADDRGHTASPDFQGSWSDDSADGTLTAEGLSPATRWLELDGTQIMLDADPVASDVSLEPLPPMAPGEWYLWRRIATPGHFGGPQQLDPIIDALRAAGAIRDGDPALDRVRAVNERMPHHHFGPSGGAPGTRGLPEPWRSLLRRTGRAGGATGTVVLGAATPEFDGFRVGVFAVSSTEDGFTADVEVTPGHVGHLGAVSLDGAELAWWARDDRGNHHLGSSNGWGSSEDRGHGELGFWPALDRRDRRLELMPTGPTTRAVIGFELPWSAAQ